MPDVVLSEREQVALQALLAVDQISGRWLPNRLAAVVEFEAALRPEPASRRYA